MKTAVIRARIPEELKKDFETVAAAHEMNLSHAIRVLISQYVKQEKEIVRRHEETLEALEEIAAGEIVNGDQVMTWLASWGNDEELEPPR